MTAYRDLTCDTARPSSVIDWTAKVVHDELLADPTGEVFTQMITDAVEAHPHADVAYIGHAVKALRNTGVCITTTKARHLSWYTLSSAADRIEEHHLRIAREQYSERVSWVRSMTAHATAGGAPPALVALHSEGQMQAMGLGRIIGLSPSQVVADCVPV